MHIVDTVKGYLGWCPDSGEFRVQKHGGAGIDPINQSIQKNSDARPPGMHDPAEPWCRRYEHTQVGRLQIYAILGIMIIVITVTLLIGAFIIPLVVLGLLVFAVLCFATLTVTVHHNTIRIRFGPIGLITKEFALSDIVSVAAVQNPWHYGYGIRWTPHGPLYNVAGKDAVEICLNAGKKVRIGTDEPEVLVREIEQARINRTQHFPR
ncbi:MAG: hypothetical protein STSR0009_31410 [Methanoregula sp.]